jgi:hypothetical protein
MTPDASRPLLAAFALLSALAPAAAQQDNAYRNVTAGGPLRPGVYGRIEVRGGTPPPVIYAAPQVAEQGVTPPRRQPVYLYVPPGQVRKWKQNCAKWSACEEPVLFVRVEQSPSRWGNWRQLRDVAFHLD